MQQPTFSVVIPTRNEQTDIAGTIEALLSVDFANIEVIIVDDSTDNTPKIIRQFREQGVRLIHPGGGGRCEARNRGILEANSEIVCILNADVRLPRDFFNKVAKHYEDGADYVLVESQVSNMGDLFARYIHCLSERNFKTSDWIEWTEGFTCRRDIAIQAGLFPEGYCVPMCAGEDGFFGAGIRNIGAKKIIDRRIHVEHVAPGTLNEFWACRQERGRGVPQVHRFLNDWTFRKIFLWNFLKSIRSFVYCLTIIPVVWKAVGLSRFSPSHSKDILPFFCASVIEMLAFHYGEWTSAIDIFKKERLQDEA